MNFFPGEGAGLGARREFEDRLEGKSDAVLLPDIKGLDREAGEIDDRVDKPGRIGPPIVAVVVQVFPMIWTLAGPKTKVHLVKGAGITGVPPNPLYYRDD